MTFSHLKCRDMGIYVVLVQNFIFVANTKLLNYVQLWRLEVSNAFFFQNLLPCLCVCVCVCIQLVKFESLFQHVGPRNQTHVIRLSGISLLSHLSGPEMNLVY